MGVDESRAERARIELGRGAAVEAVPLADRHDAPFVVGLDHGTQPHRAAVDEIMSCYAAHGYRAAVSRARVSMAFIMVSESIRSPA